VQTLQMIDVANYRFLKADLHEHLKPQHASCLSLRNIYLSNSLSTLCTLWSHDRLRQTLPLPTVLITVTCVNYI